MIGPGAEDAEFRWAPVTGEGFVDLYLEGWRIVEPMVRTPGAQFSCIAVLLWRPLGGLLEEAS